MAHILFGVSKSILDSRPALLTNQACDCSMKSLIFRDVEKFFYPSCYDAVNLTT